MNVRATAKALRRSSIATLDRLTYVPISRLTFNIMLNVLISQRWLFAGVRPAADYVIARTTPVVPGIRVRPVSAPVRGEWVWAPEADDGVGAVLVLHGSGYLICSARTHRGFASHLSEYSGMPSFAIDYRLAPEHPFPAAEDDALAAARLVRLDGINALLIDTSPRAQPFAQRLATEMGAAYLVLPYADAAAVSNVVRAEARRPGAARG